MLTDGTAARDVRSLQDADKLLRAFVNECIADPEFCELGRDTTSNELEMKIYDLIQEIKYEPLPLPSALIDYTSLKGAIFNALYFPTSWPLILAPALQSLLTGNISNPENLALLSTDPSRRYYPEAQVGIQCLDMNSRFTELEQIRPVVNAVEGQSKLYGDNRASLAIRCARWGFESKERYTGDFSVKTQHPVLLTGNTLDPITPLAGAHNLSASLQGSVVLEREGYGVRIPHNLRLPGLPCLVRGPCITDTDYALYRQHSSISQTSTCLNRAIGEYFKTGKLPEPGTKCEVVSKRVFRVSEDPAAAALLKHFL